jgi:hypothetical protein
LTRDADILILCDTDSPAKAAAEIAAQRPPVVLVDREMVLNPAFGRLAQLVKPLPAIVFVTVNREGVPPGHVLPVAGTLAFDARPGEISRSLRSAIDSMRATAAPVKPPDIPTLKSRFTIAEPGSQAKGAVRTESHEPGSSEKTPAPSKTSQMTKTGFLRSVFDAARASDREASRVR